MKVQKVAAKPQHGLVMRRPQTQWAWAGFFFYGIAQAFIQLFIYYMTEKIVNAEVLIFNLW